MLGIVKAYTTRVGSGPFPTEQDNEIGQRLGERGHEFGTVTGRQRRCGWFDAVLVRQAVAVSGVTGIALTKLDVLDGFETVKICTGYRIDGETFDYLPPHAADQARVEPVYEEIEGWPGSTARRAQLGRPAGAGDQICPPDRGADPLPGGAGQHLARARRHDPGARPVRGLVPDLEVRRSRSGSTSSDVDVLDLRRGRAAAHPLDHLLDRSLRRPRRCASTEPSGQLRTQPLTPSSRACSRVQARKNTPCTRPVTRDVRARPRPSHRRDVRRVLGLHADDIVAGVDMVDLAGDARSRGRDSR